MRTQRRGVALVILAAVTASGCGGGSSGSEAATNRVPGAWTPTVCGQVAQGVAWQGEQALRHYRPPQSTYPPDVALLIVRTAVGGLERHRCPPEIVGAELSRRLSPKQRAELFSHLPTRVVGYVRRGLANG